MIYTKRIPWLVVACLLAIGAMLASRGASAGTVYYVSNTGSDANVGSDPTFPKQHIQAAINATVSGDFVLVVNGTYTGADNKDLDFGGKSIVVASASGNPALCVIDCEGSGRGFFFHNGESLGSVVSGFTVTNGSAPDGGGGMLILGSSPTVRNCAFTGNNAPNDVGGGMFNTDHSNPTVTNCTFTGNSAGAGGGMYNLISNPTVNNCTFIGSTEGGGMGNSSSSPTVTNCLFSENISLNDGGGMANAFGSNPTVTDCTFSGNTTIGISGRGGGMANTSSNPAVINCIFTGNRAQSGGGMSNLSSSPTVTNCVFIGNYGISAGGGMEDLYSSPTVTNCTFSGNLADGGGGIANSYNSNPTVTNSILWKNGGIEILNSPGSFTTVTYSDVGGYPELDGGDYAGVGNIIADPRFVRNPSPGPDLTWGTADDDYGDLHLQAGSPCIDTGATAAVTPGTFPVDGSGTPMDMDGSVRVVGAGVDMGAYEWHSAGPGPITVVLGGIRYNRATGRFVQTVVLYNYGAAVTGPISLALDGLDPIITLYNQTGVTSASIPAGSPYRDVMPGGMAAFGSFTMTLEFINPTNTTIHYSPRILTGAISR